MMGSPQVFPTMQGNYHISNSRRLWNPGLGECSQYEENNNK